MEPLSNLNWAREGLPLFTKNLGKELTDFLNKRAYVALQTRCQRDSYSLVWVYENFSASIMISTDRPGQDKNSVTIDQFAGIQTAQGHYSSKSLREIAQIDEDVRSFIRNKFGEPIAQHEDRVIYQASLPKSSTSEDVKWIEN